jgi:hypothetical protein
MELPDKKEELDELLDIAQAHFKEAEAGWLDQRQASLDDTRFYRGTQWDSQLISVAKVKKEPTLTVNRLPQYVKNVENGLRQQDMAISVHATDSMGSDDTANIFTGLIRAIEAESHAKSHYINAAGENGALVPGIGYLKVCVDYANGNDFDQKISITSVKDPMKVLCDPAALEPDFSDAEYWFEFDDYAEKTFKRLFPQAECASADIFPTGARDSKWINENGIRVARFWYKEETVQVHYLLDDGTIISNSEIQGPEYDRDDQEMETNPMSRMIDDETIEDALGNRKIILRRRDLVTCRIKWCDFSGAEILDQGEWAGDFFPLVAVTGPITIVDGTRDIRGIIRYAKDSQKMLNYMASSAARRIASANKSPWIVEASSIKNYKRMWDTTNTENWPYLPYDTYDANGNLRQIPPPVRADQTGQIQDLLQAAAKFEDDLKATIGIYDAGLGATPNEQSGIAIKTLAQQGQNSNFHFSDNLVRSLQQVGRVLVNLIPRIYDTPRVIRTITAEGKQKIVRINEVFDYNGQAKMYNMTEGDYDVSIDVGPAYATAKQAAIEQMLELARVNPNILPYIQDIIAGNMDFPGKEQVRDRLLKVLAITAPQMVEGTLQADLPPQAMAAMQQQTEMIKQLTIELQNLQQEYAKLTQYVQTKQMEHQLEMEKIDKQTASSMAIESQKSANTQTIEEMRTAKEAMIAQSNMEMAAIKAQLSHTEKMMNLVMNSIKLFGPNADNVIAEVLPSAANTVENSINSMQQPLI